MSFKVIKEEPTYDPYTVVGMLNNRCPSSNLHSVFTPPSLPFTPSLLLSLPCSSILPHTSSASPRSLLLSHLVNIILPFYITLSINWWCDLLLYIIMSVIYMNDILCQITANVGGTMGLCFGASLLSLFEFVDFLLVALTKRFQQRRNVGVSVDNLVHPFEC